MKSHLSNEPTHTYCSTNLFRLSSTRLYCSLLTNKFLFVQIVDQIALFYVDQIKFRRLSTNLFLDFATYTCSTNLLQNAADFSPIIFFSWFRPKYLFHKIAADFSPIISSKVGDVLLKKTLTIPPLSPFVVWYFSWYIFGCCYRSFPDNDITNTWLFLNFINIYSRYKFSHKLF